jgi:hypothetical protein
VSYAFIGPSYYIIITLQMALPSNMADDILMETTLNMAAVRYI